MTTSRMMTMLGDDGVGFFQTLLDAAEDNGAGDDDGQEMKRHRLRRGQESFTAPQSRGQFDGARDPGARYRTAQPVTTEW
jgi:hypothetical protein